MKESCPTRRRPPERLLAKRVAVQDERIAPLERRVERSSRASSQPPSSDPPGKEHGPQAGQGSVGAQAGRAGWA
ncbi:MAG: DUF6444 domain-containing protein [Actinobacteria bacterium]|nr:DUF6444 domain-containing protein [Actinomycetota bacterium]